MRKLFATLNSFAIYKIITYHLNIASHESMMKMPPVISIPARNYTGNCNVPRREWGDSNIQVLLYQRIKRNHPLESISKNKRKPGYDGKIFSGEVRSRFVLSLLFLEHENYTRPKRAGKWPACDDWVM
jgi:hypothetical protein